MNVQVKERDQEYRLNELKIKELRRQLPAKVLKPIDSKAKLEKETPARQSPSLPPQAPKPASVAISEKVSDNPSPPKEAEADAEEPLEVLKQEEGLDAAEKEVDEELPAEAEQNPTAETVEIANSPV